jgi:DNA-binding XRE family transcriptional regulator
MQMTNLQKNETARLRKDGMSYNKIAETLGVSKDTIKSFCRRNGLGNAAAVNSSGEFCRQCGESLGESVHKTKRFCCDACRMAWWKAHPECLNRKAMYCFTCLCCGSGFESYGNKDRKYCSRSCYAKAKAVGSL